MLEYILAHQIIENRMREANQQHLAREVRRGEQPSPAETPVRKTRRPSRLWSLVFRQATS